MLSGDISEQIPEIHERYSENLEKGPEIHENFIEIHE